MEFIYNLGIEDIGICIVLFTIIIYTLMLPLTIKQQKSSRMMAIMNPELQAIQKKYKNKKDQASMLKMQEETKLVYEKYGTSPTGGCLGSLIQLPILFSLWPVVSNIPAYVPKIKKLYSGLVNEIVKTDGYVEKLQGISETLKNNKFENKDKIIDALYQFNESDWTALKAEGNFDNLSKTIETTQESLNRIINFCGINMVEKPWNMIQRAIDFDNFSFSNINIWLLIVGISIPLLAGLTQFINAKVSQINTNKNNNKTEENEMAQSMNMMLKFMPIMSIVMCFSMPAGLGIYWITSAVIRTIQQVVINKVLDRKSVDDIVFANTKKIESKKGKKSATSKLLNEMAQANTKKVEEPKKKMASKTVTNNKEVNSYKSNAKSGSLASKANMVSDFNNRKK